MSSETSVFTARKASSLCSVSLDKLPTPIYMLSRKTAHSPNLVHTSSPTPNLVQTNSYPVQKNLIEYQFQSHKRQECAFKTTFTFVAGQNIIQRRCENEDFDASRFGIEDTVSQCQDASFYDIRGGTSDVTKRTKYYHTQS